MGRNHSDVLDRILAMKMVSGLLALLPGQLSRHLTQRFQQGLPLVMIDDQEEPTSIPWIGVDNRAGAYEATRHLLDLGHRRIAHIMGPQSYYCAIERYQGYCQAMQDVGFPPAPDLLLQGEFEIESGRRCATQLFARSRDVWPTAIFAGNDEMAYGLLDIAEKQGIRIPEDVAVVGFDDNIFSAHMHPPLTTIRQPFSEMGYKAAEILLTTIDPDHRKERDKGASQPRSVSAEPLNRSQPTRVQFPTNLIVRASSGVSLAISS